METEQNINIETPELNQVNNSDKSGNIMEQGLSAVKKPGKGLIAGMIVCAILAVAGIGFGVWAMMDGNAKTDELNSQVAKSNAQVAQLQKQNEELIEEAKNAKGSGSSSDVDESVNSADYIYIGEWGIKIKMPEDLNVINYSLSDGDTYGEYLSVSGAKEKNNGVTPKFAHLDMFSGSIVRSNSDDGFYPYGILVYTDNAGKKYYYEGPNGIPDLPEEDYKLWEEVKELLKESLTNPENFSAI